MRLGRPHAVCGSGGMSRAKIWLLNPDVIDRYAQGQSCCEIADAYGVGSDTISRALKSVGIKVSRRRQERAWTRAEEQLLLRLRSEKRTYADIASMMARTRRSIEGKLYQLRTVRSPELYMRRRGVNYSEAA